MNNKKLYN